MTRCLPWLLLMTGCYGDVIHVDARVTETQRLEMLAAADMWNERLAEIDPGRHVDFVFDDGSGNRLVFDSTINCGHTYQPGVDRVVSGQVIHINPDCPAPFRDAIAHELGHFLGIDHGGVDGHGHQRDGSGLMAAHAYGPGDVPHDLSCGDLVAYCQYNSCVADRPSGCR